MRKKIYTLLSLVMLCMSVLLLFSQWKTLPQSIPAHINWNGTTSGAMNKSVLWFLPLLQAIISVLLFLPVNKKTMRFINIPYKRKILKLNETQFEEIKPFISELLISTALWSNFLFYYILKLFISVITKQMMKDITIYILMILVLLIVLVFYSGRKIKRKMQTIQE